MYETPNFEPKFQNRWKATPAVESSSYTFTVDNSDKNDGMQIEASVPDGSNVESVKTGIVLYDSIPRITKYPQNVSPVEGEKFPFECEFNYWGSGHSEFLVFLKDKKMNFRDVQIIFVDGLATFKSNFIASKEMNDNNIFCQMILHRTIGKSSLKFKSQPIKFQVHYKVENIKITSEKDNSTTNGKTEISCSAEGNPAPKCEWRKKSSDKILSTNPTMKIVESSDDEYKCTAWNVIKGTKHELTKTISFSSNGASRMAKFNISLISLMFVLLLTIFKVEN
ncbi:DgyrCDS14819 [Dimorphilus gyrociliatus]|nr:DgyrCDS14819 [Dimorphilus gyrociliatus]